VETLAIVGAVSGCGVPPVDRIDASLVPEEEVRVARLVTMGLEAFRGGNFDDAVEFFGRAYELEPNARPVVKNYATALTQAEQYEEAISLFKGLVQQRSEDPELLFALGNAYRGAKQYREAIATYREGLDTALSMDKPPPDDIIASIARALAATLFTVGLEREARCVSELAYWYKSSPDDILRHLKILREMGAYQFGIDLLQAQYQPAAMKQEPRPMHEMALMQFGLGKIDAFKEAETTAQKGSEDDVFLSRQLRALYALLTNGESLDSDKPVTDDEIDGALKLLEPELPFLPAVMQQQVQVEIAKRGQQKP
jgi:tetratricopeptide (TPR) repeat protein